MREEYPSAAKAEMILLGLIGTTQVVPFQSRVNMSYSAACKAQPLFVGVFAA
jgi:hypothetical protein